MKAAHLETTGGPEVIRYGDLPTPAPGPGEVRVRVAAAAVNPIDTYIRSGAVKMDLPTPFIPGCDLAGTVDAVGPGVTRFQPGDRVWGSNQGLLGRQGTFAEYCCAGEEWLYPLPAGVGEKDAAAVALVGITAHLGLFWRAGLKPGETVFVNGGSGGVGGAVVQMAKAVGATVVATVGSNPKAMLARGLGADHVINYKTDDVAAAVQTATAGRGVNVWYETQSPTDLDRTVALTAPLGRIVVMAGRSARPEFPTGPFYVKGLTLSGFAMFNVPADEQRQSAEEINRWLAEGKLRAVIGREFPLSQAAAAHRLQEDNTLGKAGTLSGKIVVLPDE
ncbi:MAG TPA: NADPH:quinone reductase [Fimbriiglobus sp.]|nr:NADPH:quinone reductase [Fimbriiglobus sp.]